VGFPKDESTGAMCLTVVKRRRLRNRVVAM